LKEKFRAKNGGRKKKGVEGDLPRKSSIDHLKEQLQVNEVFQKRKRFAEVGGPEGINMDGSI